MMPKKRQTALDIASKLPVAELLPMLARPRPVRHAHPNEAPVSSAAKRSLLELEAENSRLREAITHLSGSLLTQKSNGFAGN